MELEYRLHENLYDWKTMYETTFSVIYYLL